MVPAGFGRTLPGCRKRRGESTSRPSTLDSRTRTSRCVSPGETRRRCWISSALVIGMESMRMLRTPKRSMNCSDCSRAPAPMANMPMTEPTPKTMPSAVRNVLVFWDRRLPKASSKSLHRPRVAGRPERGGIMWLKWCSSCSLTLPPPWLGCPSRPSCCWSRRSRRGWRARLRLPLSRQSTRPCFRCAGPA